MKAKRITIIDDDFSMAEMLREHLKDRGHRVILYKTPEAACSALDRIATSDIVVIDAAMKTPPGLRKVGMRGALGTGFTIARELIARKRTIRIIVWSNLGPEHFQHELAEHPEFAFVCKSGLTSQAEISRRFDQLLTKSRKAAIRTFLVHGHDRVNMLELKNYLQNKLRVPQPIILHEQEDLGRTIIEKFEESAAGVDLVFVLLTPDDPPAGSARTNRAKRRARQNVIFEMGYFLGALGRRSGRVLLLHKGPIELPTDISGIVYIDISHGIEAAGERIRRELSHVLGQAL